MTFNVSGDGMEQFCARHPWFEKSLPGLCSIIAAIAGVVLGAVGAWIAYSPFWVLYVHRLHGSTTMLQYWFMVATGIVGFSCGRILAKDAQDSPMTWHDLGQLVIFLATAALAGGATVVWLTPDGLSVMALAAWELVAFFVLTAVGVVTFKTTKYSPVPDVM